MSILVQKASFVLSLARSAHSVKMGPPPSWPANPNHSDHPPQSPIGWWLGFPKGMPPGSQLIGNHPVCSHQGTKLVLGSPDMGRWIHDRFGWLTQAMPSCEGWVSTSTEWGTSTSPWAPLTFTAKLEQPCAPEEGTLCSARQEGEVTEVSHKGDDSSSSCLQPQPLLPLTSPCQLQETLWHSGNFWKLRHQIYALWAPRLTLVNMKHFSTPIYTPCFCQSPKSRQHRDNVISRV